MKPKIKTRRVLNIQKDRFDIIKKYCEKHSYNMSKWVPYMILAYIKSVDLDLKNKIELIEKGE